MELINKMCYGVAVAATLIACTKQETSDNRPEKQAGATKEISVSTAIETGAYAKTTLRSGEDAITWKIGDKFEAFNDAGDSRSACEYDGSSAKYTITVDEGATEVYALYPYRDGDTKSSARIGILQNFNQEVAGSMSGSAVPMYAKATISGSSANLVFKPVPAILSLNIYNTSEVDMSGKKIEKVTVTPLNADGTEASNYCGYMDADLSSFSAFSSSDGKTGGISVTLGTPCSIATVKPSTDADRLAFANKIFVPVARREAVYKFKINVFTDDEWEYEAVTTTTYDLQNNDLVDINVNIGNSNFKQINMNDFKSIWEAGRDIDICGQVVNKTSHPTADDFSANSINSALGTSGLHFVDNSKASRTWSYSSARIKQIANGVVLIGRYKNYPQPVMANSFGTDSQGTFSFDGTVMLMNYRIETKDSGYGAILGKSGVANAGTQDLYFQDCTIVNSAGGITSFNNGSYAIPRSYHFDNCIIRVTGKLFRTGSSSQNADKLEGIYFNNTVIAPYSGSRYAADGSLIDFSTAGSDSKITDNVNIGLSYCTVYEYGTTTNARGLMAVANCALVQVDHSAFYHSSYVGANVYTLYASQACTTAGGGIEMSASYANVVDSKCQSVGNKGNITNSNADDRKWSGAINQAAQTVVTESVNASNDYFPVAVIHNGDNKLGGASYDSKYWVSVN